MRLRRPFAVFDMLRSENRFIFIRQHGSNMNKNSGVAGPLVDWCGGQICRPIVLGFGKWIACLKPRVLMPKVSGQSSWIEEVGERIPSLSLPPLSPSTPFPPLRISLPLRSRASQLGGLGERCKLPQRGLGGAPVEIEFVHFSLKF